MGDSLGVERWATQRWATERRCNAPQVRTAFGVPAAAGNGGPALRARYRKGANVGGWLEAGVLNDQVYALFEEEGADFHEVVLCIPARHVGALIELSIQVLATDMAGDCQVALAPPGSLEIDSVFLTLEPGCP